MIQINGKSEGRRFEGIGGIFSNGMTKLLMDYPKEQRDDILRFLFEDNFGASLQHVKVEIGSDVNTSSGTVPSHMRSSEDFDIERGSELWIAALAKQINPSITTEALRWGTPAWIHNHEDKYLYYLNFLKGARDKFGIHFDYLGCDENEGSFDRDWVVRTLKPGLIRDGFGDVKLTGADGDCGWGIADHIQTDMELRDALDVLNCHYTDTSSETAVHTGKKLWMSEHLGPFRHNYKIGTVGMALHMLAMYPLGRMTMYEMHPALESNYPSTPFNYKGMIAASWPWSGHYEICSGLWAAAHFTQFVKPGWMYLDKACHADESGGYVTLKAPDQKNWSMILVNNTNGKNRYKVHVEGGLLTGSLHVRETTQEHSFIRKDDMQVTEGGITIELEPYSIYSLSTMGGQKKGEPVWPVPQDREMPLPFEDDYTCYKIGSQPLFTSDQGGAFEVGEVEGEKVLVQKILADHKPLDWVYRITPEPYTLIGSELWLNYQVRVQVKLPHKESYAYVGGRATQNGKFDTTSYCYNLKVNRNGIWQMRMQEEILREGYCESLTGKGYHQLTIGFIRDAVTAWIDGEKVGCIKDGRLSAGQAVLGSSYHETAFASLQILEAEKGLPVSCKRYNDKDSRIIYQGDWECLDGGFENFGRTLSGSCASGSRAVFEFMGTGVSIIGNREMKGGIAEVYVDDLPAEEVDTYCITEYDRKTGAPIPKTRNAIFTSGALPYGCHRVEVAVTGRRNKKSAGSYVSIDAVEIVGGTLR